MFPFVVSVAWQVSETRRKDRREDGWIGKGRERGKGD